MKAFLLLALAVPMFAQTRIAIVDVALKQQTQTVWSVTLYNESQLQVQVPRALLLIRATQVSQMLASQADANQQNGFFAVTARTGMELEKLAPAALTMIGVSISSTPVTYAGLGLAFVDYLIMRAQARAQPTGQELPAVVPLGAGAGGEYLLHTSKSPKGAAPVVLQLSLIVP